MSLSDHPEHPQDEALDQIVRAHLERESSRAETSALLARIRADVPAWSAAPSPATSARDVARVPRPAWLWPAAVAAALALAFLGGRYLNPAAASPAQLLRDVQVAHRQPIDHCYSVQFAPDPRFTDPDDPLERPTDNTLWTRGDRFWCDCAIADTRLAVGRDESGQLWCAPSRKKGILLPSRDSQLSREIELICAINSMSIPRLVDEVLDGFVLEADAPDWKGDGGTALVWARLKPGETHPLLSAAAMEVDTESDVVSRLILWIVRDGHPHGTVTYTLVESAVHDDAQYRLAAHIDAAAEIQVQTAE